jgi:hypothetical protein
VVNDLLADRSEQQGLEAAEAAPADDDERRVGALLEQHIRRLSLERQRFSFQGRLQLLRRCERIVGDLLTYARTPAWSSAPISWRIAERAWNGIEIRI